MNERQRDKLLDLLERQQHSDQGRQEANRLFLKTVSEMTGLHHDHHQEASLGSDHRVDRKLLLEKGANANAEKNNGYTALMISCQKGHELCARALLEAGARKHLKTKGIIMGLGKQTAASIARSNVHTAIYALLIGRTA